MVILETEFRHGKCEAKGASTLTQEGLRDFETSFLTRDAHVDLDSVKGLCMRHNGSYDSVKGDLGPQIAFGLMGQV